MFTASIKAILLVTSFLTVAFVVPVDAQSGQVTLKPTDDTYISFWSDSNYGSSEIMRVSLTYTTWLKFDLSSIPEGAIGITAVLELYTTYEEVTNPHSVVACLILNNSWSEDTITSSNAPYYGGGVELDTEYVANDETWYEWDVTEAVVNATVNNATTISIILRYPWGVGAPSFSFYSKEASLTKSPKLTIFWTDIIQEFPSFIILPIFMITILLAVIIHKRKTYSTNNTRNQFSQQLLSFTCNR